MTVAWNRLQAELASGAISRRAFLAGATALGVSVATAEHALAQTPKRGGHLIMGVDRANSTDSLDPATWTSAYIQTLGSQVYDTLTVVDDHMQIKPALFESWEPKPGVKEWVFKLRQGVTFHNGKTLTPADVIASLNHHRGADSKSMAKSMVSGIADIKETAPNEITMTLESGNADLPSLLSDWHLGIVPEGSKYDGVGTGPFALQKFEPGVRATTKRNANDWRKDRGYVESVETVGINDATARTSALLSGSVHIANSIPLATVDSIAKSAQVQLFSIPGLAFSEMAMQVGTPPYDNLDLRLALKYAIDREAIVKTVLRGYGRVGNDQPVPASDPFFAKDIPQRKFDPEKAKFHYKKSGHSGPITFTTSAGASSGAVDIAQIFQASAQKAGIDFQINRAPDDGYYTNVWKKVPFFASYSTGRPTADIVLTTFFLSTSPLNETGWKSEKFDQILIAARAELDTAKRKQMYHDAQMMVSDEAATIIPIFNNNIDGGAKNIRGFAPSPVGQLRGYRVAENVWFA